VAGSGKIANNENMGNMNMMKFCKTLLTIVAFLLPGLNYAAAPIVIKFSYVTAPNTPKGKAAERFKRSVEMDTQGRVKIELYPDGKLFKDDDEMAALQRGAVEMLAPALSKFSPLGVSEFGLFDLPYIFPDKKTLYRVMDGDIGKRIFAKLAPKGMLGLAYWDNGFKQISANRAVIRVKDFKGLKIRIQASNKVLEAEMRALGAQPKVFSSGKQYAALKEGAADGAENTVSNFYTLKLYEVQKHLTLSNHSYLGYAVVVNKMFWDKLPPDIRTILEQNMKEATEYQRRIAQDENDAAVLRVMQATEIHTLPENIRQEWIKTLLPVHKEAEDIVGKENLSAIYAITAQTDKEERERKQKKSGGVSSR
jgi:C4-dicarboxylate-binding protein DctP